MISKALLLLTSAGTKTLSKRFAVSGGPTRSVAGSVLWRFVTVGDEDGWRRVSKRKSSCELSIETAEDAMGASRPPIPPPARQEFGHFAAVYALGPR